MNPKDTFPQVDVLLANASWVRRLATNLLRDPAAADEVAQEALLAGWRHPPTTDRPVRAWFGQVVRNLVINRTAQDRARTRREHEAAVLTDGVPSPEEMAARMEIQRLIIGLVAELDEPYRHTVLLRYFEERTAEEIAHAQGIPASTVRWRLKVALDRLRSRLRDREGAESWRARLAILGLPARPARSGAAAALVVALAGTMAVVVAVKATGPRRSPSAATTTKTAAIPPTFAAIAPVDLARCQSTVARLRQELVIVDAELRRYGDAAKLFDEMPASAAAQAAIAPLIDRALDRPDAAVTHVVECHTGVCRVVILAASQEAYETGVRLDRESQRELGLRSWRVDFPRKYTRVTDPLSGEIVRRYVFELALKDPDGRPVTGDLPEAPPRSPPATAGDCDEELKTLERRLQAARPARDRALPAMEQFARQPANAALTRTARAQVQRSAGGAFSAGAITCHGRVCRVDDFELAAHLGRDAAFMNVFRGPWRDATGAYFRAVEPGARNEADDFLRALLWEKSGARPGLGLDGFLPLDLCRGRAPSDGVVGRLTIHLVVPATGELNADGEPDKISVHLDGDAALTSPFGQCLAAEIHKRTDGVRVPEPMPTRAEKEMQFSAMVPGRPK